VRTIELQQVLDRIRPAETAPDPTPASAASAVAGDSAAQDVLY
jgi:hypothetical protein